MIAAMEGRVKRVEMWDSRERVYREGEEWGEGVPKENGVGRDREEEGFIGLSSSSSRSVFGRRLHSGEWD